MAHAARLDRVAAERAEDRPTGIEAKFTAKLEPWPQRLKQLRIHAGKSRLAAHDLEPARLADAANRASISSRG
jgi:hypothetical protein